MQLVPIAEVLQSRGVGVEALVCFLSTLCPAMTWAVSDGCLMVDSQSARSVADASSELARAAGIGAVEQSE